MGEDKKIRNWGKKLSFPAFFPFPSFSVDLFLLVTPYSTKEEKNSVFPFHIPYAMQSAMLRRAGAKGLRNCGCRTARASMATLAAFRPPTITNEPNVSEDGR